MSNKTGLWLIGARGGVAATAILGLCLLRRGKIDSCGLVTSGPEFAPLELVDWNDVAVGGHEIRKSPLAAAALQLARTSRAFPESFVDECLPELDEIDRQIRPGVLLGVGPTIRGLADPDFSAPARTPAEAIARIQADLDAFVATHNLERLVVVNVASTEPPSAVEHLPPTWSELQPQLNDADLPLPASSLYAIAALDRGYAYVNFTPSVGSNLPALRDLAELRQTCHAGRDGKTGETFMKSVLAPAFAARSLQVMSWVGHNIFGNMDGQVLNDPVNKSSKVTSKDKLLGEILGYRPQTHVSIEYIESLGDWKTAWDHIHFRGFLGTPMIMQFVWQGCDSILAAPLVLDLTRLTERAQRGGAVGELGFLASFFKSPQGCDRHEFDRQYAELMGWMAELLANPAGT